MKYSIRITVAFAFFILFCLCKEEKRGVTAFITSDDICIGAEVFANSMKVGVIEERIVDQESQYSKLGDKFGRLIVKLPLGVDTLRIVKADGTEITKEIRSYSEAYLYVNCEKGIIRGGD